jgi:hypothetical protein
MALQRQLDSLDGLNEAVAGEYTKGADGKYHLGLEGTDPNATAMQEWRDKHNTLETTVGELQRKQIPDGVDLAALQSAQAELEALKKKPEEGDQSALQGLKDQIGTLETRLADDVKAAETKGLTYLETHKTHLKETAARAALVAAGAKDVEKLLPHVLPHLEVKQDGEKFVARCVKDDKDLYSVATPSQLMAPEEFIILNVAKRWPDDFDTEVKFGSGKESEDGTPGRGGNAVVITKEQGKDTAFYRQKRKEAQDAGVEFIVQ